MNRKEIIIADESSPEVPRMMWEIFGKIINALITALDYKRDLRREALNVCMKFKEEYKEAEKTSIHYGLKSKKKVMEESNIYGLSQAKEFMELSKTLDNDPMDQFCNLAKEAPAEFISAIITVLSGGKGSRSLSTNSNDCSDLMTDLLRSIKLQEGSEKNNETIQSDSNRRKFGANAED
jgi:hypothetical protein